MLHEQLEFENAGRVPTCRRLNRSCRSVVGLKKPSLMIQLMPCGTSFSSPDHARWPVVRTHASTPPNLVSAGRWQASHASFQGLPPQPPPSLLLMLVEVLGGAAHPSSRSCGCP